MIILIISLAAISLVYCLYKKLFKSPKGLPPLMGPGIVDTVKKLSTITDLSSLEFFHDMSLKVTSDGGGKTSNGAIFRINMPQLNPYVITTDYKLARKVLEGNSKENIPEGEKTPTVRVFDYASTPSILTNATSSMKRHQHRKHLAVSFSTKNLEYTQKVIKECLEKFGNILQKHAEEKTPVVLDNAMIRLTLDIITESAFGVNFNTMAQSDDNLGDFYMHENELFLKEAARSGLNPVRKLMFWNEERCRAMSARANLMKLAQNLIDNHRKQYSDSEKSMTDDRSIMGRLMSCDYDSDEKRAQDILIMLLGGHETSSHTVSYLILALLRHPEVKRKLQNELDSCISREARHDITKLNVTDIMNLPYLSQCMKESNRLWHVIGGGLNRVLTHDIHYEGYFLPKGSTFRAAFYSMSRQPWIEKADEFLPERWSDSNPQHAELKEMLLPFGAGKRQCIGQNLAKIEVAMIAAYTLRFFDFKLVSEPVEQLFLTTKPVNMTVEVHSRV